MTFPEPFLEFLKLNGYSADIYEPSRPVKRFFALNPMLPTSTEELRHDFPEGYERCQEFDPFFELIGNHPQNVFSESSLYRRGAIIPMDITSGLAVKYLNPRPDEHILDLCCAPGTKLALASLVTRCRASFTGVDISKHRLATARSLVKKYKLGLVRLIHADGTTVDRRPFFVDSNGEDVEVVK